MSRRGKGGAPWRAKRRRMIGLVGLVLVVLMPALIWRANLASRAREALEQQRALGRLEVGPWDGVSEEAFRRSSEGDSREVDVPPDPLAEFLPYSGGKSKALLVEEDWTPEVLQVAGGWVSAHEAVLAGWKTESGEGELTRTWGLPWDERRQRIVDLAYGAAIVHGAQGDGAVAERALTILSALALEPEVLGPEARIPGIYGLHRAVEFASARVMLEPAVVDGLIAALAPERQLRALAERARFEQRMVLSRMREGRNRGFRRLILLATGVGDLNVIASARTTDLVVGWCEGTVAERSALESAYDEYLGRLRSWGGLYGTVGNAISGIPGRHWAGVLDQLAVMRAGLAVWRHRGETGAYPESLEGLAGQLPEGALALFSDGSPLRLEPVEGGVDVVGGAGSGDVRFRVRYSGG